MLRFTRFSKVAASSIDNNTFNRSGYFHSILSNGLRVLTHKDTATTSTVALFSRCGTRYENDGNAGICSILESITFKGNAKLKQPEFSHELIAVSAAIRASNLRELFSWSVTVPRFSVEDAIELLNGVALHPVADDQCFQDAKLIAMERLAFADRDQTRLVFDYLHDAAYGGKAVGRTQLVKSEQIAKITRKDFEDFLASCVQPHRSVVVGLGIDDHEAFVTRIENVLKFKSTVSNPIAAPICDEDIGFTGGEIKVFNDRAPDSIQKFEEQNHTHVALCFRGVNHDHPDYYTYSVAQALLGGGMSFSSGGPGKGMHTKLFREVSRREGWVQSIECLTAWYSHVGLFGLYATGPHEFAGRLLQLMMFQAATISERVLASDLEMAKNQFLSQLVLLSDSRDVACDEAGKNLLLHNALVTPEDLMKGAEGVTMDDLRRCMSEMIQKKPALVVYGNTKDIGSLDDVWGKVQSMHNSEKGKKRW